ncbi:P44/Msp2 family outer membrane protein [Anaplasma capra]|nr:P44/Msp2 family outer membrane protein [Anaplasma capra]
MVCRRNFVAPVVLCLFCSVVYAKVCSAANFYASAGYRPALHDISGFSMYVGKQAADVFLPGIEMCCDPMAARNVVRSNVVRSSTSDPNSGNSADAALKSAKTPAVGYSSSDTKGVFGALGVARGNFRMEFAATRNFFDLVHTKGYALTGYRSQLLIRKKAPSRGGSGSNVVANVKNGLLAVRDRGIGNTSAVVSACYDVTGQFLGAPLVPHFCVGSGVDIVSLFGTTRSSVSVEGKVGFHRQLSPSTQLVASAFMHGVLDSAFDDLPIIYPWKGVYRVAAAAAPASEAENPRNSMGLRVSGLDISYFGIEVGLRLFL